MLLVICCALTTYGRWLGATDAYSLILAPGPGCRHNSSGSSGSGFTRKLKPRYLETVISSLSWDG